MLFRSDGVYLDHLRFPGDDFDYGPRSLAAFRDWVRGRVDLERRRTIDEQEEIDPLAYPTALPVDWRAFRRGQLTALLARIRTAVRASRPAATVAVALADADVRAGDGERLADWRTWVDSGFVDAGFINLNWETSAP